MARGKVITAKVFIGIICSVLILGTIFMTAVLLVLSGGANRPNEIYTPYNNIPNICGDDCVYVSENFFYENNLNIPTNIGFRSMRDLSNMFRVEGTNYFYKGRAKELAYSFMTSSNKNEQLENCAITVKCDSVNIEKLKNKQEYNEYVYGVETKDILKDKDSEIMVYYCIYVIDFKRNENTSKKCQLTMEISIEHDKDMPTENYKERSDKLFYSLLDNVVYRNV